MIALLGGASFQISGPTGAMSAVLVGIVAAHGLQGVFFACFAAGVLLLIAGVLRLGRLISFIPMPVIMGFTSGIAIIIALGQIDNFFGTTSEGLTNIKKLLSYGRLGFHVNWQAALIGLLVVAVMVVWPKKWGARVPGSLVGIIAAAIVAGVFHMDSLATVGDIPRPLLLAPWDKSVLKEVEKAILPSDIGITPQNGGSTLRLQFPPMTEERRRDLSKEISKMGEECKVAIRSIRRDAIDKLKNLKKKNEITEDDEKNGEKKMQDLTDRFVKEIDKLAEAKQKEIMEI